MLTKKGSIVIGSVMIIIIASIIALGINQITLQESVANLQEVKKTELLSPTVSITETPTASPTATLAPTQPYRYVTPLKSQVVVPTK